LRGKLPSVARKRKTPHQKPSGTSSGPTKDKYPPIADLEYSRVYGEVVSYALVFNSKQVIK